MDSKTLTLVAIALISGVMLSTKNAEDMTSQFESFKSTYTKSYGTAEEEAYRFAVFTSNQMEVQKHNQLAAGSTWGLTEFSDMTPEEFESKYLTLKPSSTKAKTTFTSTKKVGDVNWVTKGMVAPVKNQGSCGSCWAFSAVASTESLAGLKTGTVGDFSEQQLVDCSTSYGNQGCNGGWMDDGFQYFIDKFICTENSYPYKGKDQTCADSSCSKASFDISGFTDVTAKSTDALMAANDVQPVSVAVGAGIAWQLYSSGIMKGWECSSNLNHGVLLAGYTDSYWLIKNSWGSSWGESGYIRLAAPNDTCGLADSASFPTA